MEKLSPITCYYYTQLMGKTRIPTHMDDEDPFLPIFAELKLSLRQALTIALALFIWAIISKFTTYIIPLSIIFALLIWSWILIAGLVLTFVKKDGRPYEEYLSHKLAFMLSSKTFIQKDPHAKYGNVEDATWEEIDDDDDEPPIFG